MNRIITLKEVRKDPVYLWDTNFVPAPVFNVKEYQEKLDSIAGKSRGQSILKLIWGGAAFSVEYTKWEGHSPIASVRKPKFALYKKVNGVEKYIPIRRWIIAQRQEAEQLEEPTFQDERGVNKPLAPIQFEDYSPYIYIGDHSLCSPDCCRDRICLGDYKAPGPEELHLVLEHTYKLASEFEGNPYLAINPELQDKIDRDVAYSEEKRREKHMDDFDYESREWFRIHGHRLDDSATPTTLKHGKYLDMGANNARRK